MPSEMVFWFLSRVVLGKWGLVTGLVRVLRVAALIPRVLGFFCRQRTTHRARTELMCRTDAGTGDYLACAGSRTASYNP